MADYYDIDDILAKEEFVPVLFHKAVNGVKIDESSERGSVDLRSRCSYFYEFGCKPPL
ncbi:hypothetical protein LINPERPRIM_LOCUS5095 [Linum perenne]